MWIQLLLLLLLVRHMPFKWLTIFEVTDNTILADTDKTTEQYVSSLEHE